MKENRNDANGFVKKQVKNKVNTEDDKFISDKVTQISKFGFCVIKNVLKNSEVDNLLYSKATEKAKLGQRMKRKRSGLQEWKGAVNSIKAHIKESEDQITILSPLTTRSQGRFDLPLPSSHEIRQTMKQVLIDAKIMLILENYVKKGKIATQNVLLSKIGSVRQPIHSDHHKKGYLTALIPLITQTKKTGGTRLFPQSHLSKDFDPNTKDYFDCVSPAVKKGDCVIFDGLLMHCGMENKSNKDRYFYYAAFCKGHDYNTDVTAT